MRARGHAPILLAGALLVVAAPARADGVDGAALLRLLGPRAQAAFAPRGAPGVGALVRLPPGVRASAAGLGDAGPGLGRIYGPPSSLLAFADAHPGWPMEVAPPLRPLLDTAARYVQATTATARGLDGAGALVGIADTGVDVTHADFRDASGHTRVAWLLDLSVAPIGKHPDLEQRFGTPDASGKIVLGAVWSAADLDAQIAAGPQGAPQDEVGHGTLVAACAAGNGEAGRSPYRGIAPAATLLVARVASAGDETTSVDDLLRGTDFLFDRADVMRQPAVVNLSFGSDFGPHDGTLDWEQALASHVGPGQPGHALVVAAGNSGSIVDTPVHQSAYVGAQSTVRVPVLTTAAQSGGAQVWVAMHPGASLAVGLDGPDGRWIDPVGDGGSAGKDTTRVSAGIYNGSTSAGSPVPSGSHGAVVVWQGAFAAGTYYVTLEGSGGAELYVEGTGDLAAGGAAFQYGVRESTISVPATHGALIAVGCTIDKTRWTTIHGESLGLAVPDLDAVGGLPSADDGTHRPGGGEPCWFSSAGPTLAGLQKPEIMAPGGAIIGAMSAQAAPGGGASIFTNPACPSKNGQPADPLCQQIDATHAVSFGTSFSAPVAAGAVAVMLQHDPTLTQDQVLAALQGGAHPLRGAWPFLDQTGPGEVDVLGAVEAVDRLRAPEAAVPVRAQSWITPAGDVLLADGSTPMQVVVELRGAPDGSGVAPPADGFAAGRLAVTATVDGADLPGAVQSLARRGPGVWVASVTPPAGLGGERLALGATFDGVDVVSPKIVVLATDAWDAYYPGQARGSGCAIGGGRGAAWWALALVAGAAARRRRARARTRRPALSR